jgi:peroxiredoxin
MKRIISVVLILCVVILAACTRKEEAKPALEGNPAPDFTARDLSGHETRLSDLKGKVVLVNFWATWCPPCRSEVPSMANLNRIMAGKPFQMLALSIDKEGKEAVQAYFARTGVTLPALLDSDGAIGKLYGITGVPETFIVDRKGVILKKVVGALDWTAPEVIAFLNDAMK